jgi:hypothetical protein
MMSHSHLPIMFVQLAQATGSLAGAALPLLLLAALAGLYVALRVMKVMLSVAETLAKEAITIGRSVFVIVIVSSLIGVTLSR